MYIYTCRQPGRNKERNGLSRESVGARRGPPGRCPVPVRQISLDLVLHRRPQQASRWGLCLLGPQRALRLLRLLCLPLRLLLCLLLCLLCVPATSSCSRFRGRRHSRRRGSRPVPARPGGSLRPPRTLSRCFPARGMRKRLPGRLPRRHCLDRSPHLRQHGLCHEACRRTIGPSGGHSGGRDNLQPPPQSYGPCST